MRQDLPKNECELPLRIIGAMHVLQTQRIAIETQRVARLVTRTIVCKYFINTYLNTNVSVRTVQNPIGQLICVRLAEPGLRRHCHLTPSTGTALQNTLHQMLLGFWIGSILLSNILVSRSVDLHINSVTTKTSILIGQSLIGISRWQTTHQSGAE